jgi:hypothetical protein
MLLRKQFCDYNTEGVAVQLSEYDTMWSGFGNSKSQVLLPAPEREWSGVETEVILGVSFVTR